MFTSKILVRTRTIHPFYKSLVSVWFISFLIAIFTLNIFASSAQASNVFSPVEGKLSVSNSGAANYKVPLEFTPGTRGIEPKLSLNYSSQGGNGLLGKGFSLQGLSAVSRCPANLAIDGVIDGVDFDSNDRFCLDGMRLLPFDGAYGANNTEYRTEIESFNKIVSYGSTGYGPSHFKVWTKSGNIMEYGSTNDSSVNPPTASGSLQANKILSWQLHKLQDRDGNYMTFDYFEDELTGEHYIQSIQYTGNESENLTPYSSIEFEYENRPDQSTKYMNGHKVTLSKRLKKIINKNGDEQIRVYELSYFENEHTGVSEAYYLKVYDSNGALAQNFYFEWMREFNLYQSHKYTNPHPVSMGAHNSPVWSKIAGDYNGDGFTDMATVSTGPAGWQILTALSNGDGTFQPKQFSSPWPHNLGAQGYKTWTKLSGDFNGDGLLDLAIAYTGPAGWQILTAQSNGDGTFRYRKFSNPHNVNHGRQDSGIYTKMTGDFNGDGLTDMAVVGTNPGGWLINVALGNGDGTFQPRIHSNPHKVNLGPHSYRGYTRLASDLNGDGLTDMAIISVGPAGWSIAAALSKGDGTFEHRKISEPDKGNWGSAESGFYKKLLGDYNGDGIIDVAAVGTGDGDFYINIALGNGDGTYQSKIFTYLPPIGNWTELAGHYEDWTKLVGDFNADSFTDIAAVGTTSTGWKILISESNGDGTFKQHEQFTPRTTSMGEIDSGAYTKLAGDFNGDGLLDMAAVATTGGGWYINTSLASGSVPGKIKKFRGALGSTQEVTYKPLTDTSVHSKSEGSNYPVVDVVPTMSVVKEVVEDNGVGGTNTLSYYYEGAKTHRRGRGFLGFSKKVVTNTSVEDSVETYFYQGYPYTGLEYLTKSFAAGEKVSEKSTIYKSPDNILNGGPICTYAEKITESQFDFNDGSLFTQTTTEYRYDSFGNQINVTITVDDAGAEPHVTTTNNLFVNPSTESWIVGKLIESKVTKQQGSSNSQSRKSTFSYNEKGKLLSEMIEPQTSHALLKQFEYDGFGNQTKITTSGSDIETRTEITRFDTTGRFPLELTNALGHVAKREFNDPWGNVTKETGPNLLVTELQYDARGRKIAEYRADGSSTNIDYTACGNISGVNLCPILENGLSPAYFVRASTQGAPANIEYYDTYNRVVLSETTSFSGSSVFKQTEYDAQGRVKRSSLPHYGNNPEYWTTNFYDGRGRVLQQNSPATGLTTYNYSKFLITATNELGQTTQEMKNGQGQTMWTADHEQNVIAFSYDPFGNLTQVSDGTNVTLHTYNQRGFKTSTIDPDMGNWNYGYNTLGEMISQTDAKQQTITITYDKLGRMTERNELEGVTTWTYDTAEYGIGKLASVEQYGGYSEVYSYDSFGRPKNNSMTINGITHSVARNYDSYSRLDEITYPSGFKVKQLYNAVGHLEKVVNADDPELEYWQAHGMNEFGNVTLSTLGGVFTAHDFENHSGRLFSINSGAGLVQSLRYQYDSLGNLIQRRDDQQSLREDFIYDNLNRLTAATLVGVQSKAYSYDQFGNIINKTEVGDYIYGGNGAGPHAVTKTINGSTIVNYTYDANGNQIAGNGRTITWSSFNKPLQIQKGSNSVSFVYGPSRARYRQVVTNNSETSVTTYVGNLYEEVVKPGSTIERKHFIKIGDQTIAVHTDFSGGTSQTHFLHRDHIGSVDVITDENQTVVERYSYDAFGQRRQVNWQDAVSAITSNMVRGFTGHEHLDGVGLIHMNGRVYDPLLGRFLSADPHIQQHKNFQNLNRYSYVNNNPLSFTDPSGFFLDKWWKEVGNFFEDFAETDLGKAVIIAAAIYTGYGVYAWLAEVGVASAIAAGVGGYTAGYIATGDPEVALQVAAAAATLGAYGPGLASAAERGLMASLEHAVYETANYYLKKEIREEVTSIAKDLNLTTDQFNLILLGVSWGGNKLVGSRYDANFKGTGQAGFYGFLRDGDNLWSIPFDVVDTVLGYQGLPTASGLEYVFDFDKPKDKFLHGHSLGTLDTKNLVRSGVANSGNLASLPFGNIAPANTNVQLGALDIINGGIFGKWFNPTANVVSKEYGCAGHAISAGCYTF